ncbi:sugar transferase [Actinacidiphila guanduensis]|uniref:sugar transferase n=1 Tax=Actinacidiphila guanduensis TaxID=310781 RepID=UPI0038990229
MRADPTANHLTEPPSALPDALQRTATAPAAAHGASAGAVPAGPLRAVLPAPAAGRGGLRTASGARRKAGSRRVVSRLLKGALGPALADGAALLVGLGLVGPHESAVLPGVLGAVLAGAFRRAGLYRPVLAPAVLDEVPSIVLGTVLAWGCAAAALAAGAPGRALGWFDLLGGTTLTVLAAVALRGLVHRLHRGAARRDPEPALLVGRAPTVRQVAEALRARPEYGLVPLGVAGCEEPEAVVRAAARHGARHVLFVGPPLPGARTLAGLLAGQGGRLWRVEPAARESGPQHLWAYAYRPVTAAPARGKRALDIALAGAALLALAPVLAACALAVRLADGPGVLFRQERIGLGGRPFTLLKFRTLRPRDEKESATRWNIADDHRMSPAGRLLRRTSLDELPQLWNVLRGDMSLVGPRPERPHFVRQFSAEHEGYADRHRMPAGITGLAQVHGLRGDTSIADRARFDNHYIDSWSLWQDVAIILRTAGSFFRFGGS